MKKRLLLIAAAATMLTACVNTEDFRDVNIQQNSENDGTIGFTSFTDKMTKGINDKAENSEALYTWTFWNHQESFQVWARKANQPEKEIFGGTKVTVERSDATPYTYTYTYAPARFWDKAAASYQFFAAAPAQPDGENPTWTWTFTHTANDLAGIANGYFSTTSTLNGVNLQSVANSGPTTALKNVFKGTTDIDKLIAAPCQVTNTYYNKPVPDAVNLNFIHILSKLNITISTSLASTYDVDILGFEVKAIPNDGTFNENTEGFTAHGKNIRWSGYSTTTDILTGIDNNTNKKDVPLTTGNKLYIVESLIIPQSIAYERIALDAAHHDAINSAAVPFTSYEAYEKARDNDVDRLTEAQFNALFATAYTTFKTWGTYTQVSETIDEATFDARVAEASEAANDPYDTFADYATAKGANATLNANQFAALIDNGAFRTWGNYTQVALENIDEATFNARVNDATDVPAINIAEYGTPTKPYFKITYSIDGEVFTANYNLAAAFLNYNNNNQIMSKDGNGKLILTNLTTEPTTFGFYEGWQNTLNIIINPTAIEFTADVAEWDDIEEKTYEIEQGNNNPNN